MEIKDLYHEDGKSFDVLIYHNNTSTSILDVTSVKEAINKFKLFHGESVNNQITDVYIFDRGNNDPEHRIKIEDWENAE